MLKKSLIFVSVALFLAVLITLTGCPTSTDDGSSGMVYAHRIYGNAVDPYLAQEAIDRAVAAGEPIVLEDQLSIDAGHLNFKNAQVRIEGRVTLAANSVVSVVDAAVTWTEGSSLTYTGGTGAYIHRRGADVSKVPVAVLVEYAEGPNDIMPTATAAGVRRFKLGPKEDFDYSVDPNGINARIRAPDLDTLYVLDELIIDSSATSPNVVGLTAMGIVDVTGTPPSSVVVGTAPVLGTCSTLTTSKGGVLVIVPDGPTTIPNIKVDAGRDFIIQQGTVGTLTIRGKLTGAGTLEVPGAVTTTIINGGNGNIRFSGTAAPLSLTILSTGTVTFDNAVAPLSAASVIAGDVVFRGNVTVTAAPLGLFGNVTLVSSSVLDFTAPASILTLGAGKTISVEFTPRDASPVIAPVLIAGPEDVVLTPVATATLTVPANPTQNNDTAVSAAKRLTLATAGLEITDGVLRVAPGATLAIDTQALTTGITVTEIGYLAVADGGAVTLLNAGSVDIGDTGIASPATSTLRAGGGTVTLGNNKIAGDVVGAVLTASAGAPVFTLAAGELLTLERADLNLAANGSVVIGAASRVILTERAKITLNNGEGGVPTTRSRINTNGVLSGGFIGLTAPTATTTQPVWSVAHQDAAAADVSIVPSAAITLGKSSTSFTN